MGNGTENLMERHEEEEKRERDKRNRWRKRLKILMILGVFQASRYWLLQNLCMLVLQYWEFPLCFHTCCMNFITNVNYGIFQER